MDNEQFDLDDTRVYMRSFTPIPWCAPHELPMDSGGCCVGVDWLSPFPCRLEEPPRHFCLKTPP